MPVFEVGGDLEDNEGIVGSEAVLVAEHQSTLWGVHEFESCARVRLQIAGAEGVLEQGRPAVSVKVGGGISGEGLAIACRRSSSEGNAGPPAGRIAVIGITLRSDQGERVPGVIRARGPRKVIVVAEGADRCPVVGVQGDGITVVVEITGELANDRESVSKFGPECFQVVDEESALSGCQDRALGKSKGDAGAEANAGQFDRRGSDIHDLQELESSPTQWLVENFGDDQVACIGGRAHDEERFIEG